MTLPELIQQAASQVRRIDAVTAYAESRVCESWFIDVREPGEVTEQPIAGSVNIPRGVLEMQMLQHCPTADTPVFIHCATSAPRHLGSRAITTHWLHASQRHHLPPRRDRQGPERLRLA